VVKDLARTDPIGEKKMNRILVLLTLCAMFIVSIPAFADVIYTDGTFNLSNYTSVGPYEANGTITASQCVSCGSPAYGLQLNVLETGNVTASVALGLLNNAFVYDPSTQGAIFSIGASVDKDTTVPAGSYGNTFRPLIEQSGNYYLAAIAGQSIQGPGSTGFITFARSGLVASDFVLFNFSSGTFGTGTPNFAGAPMLFGLTQITGGATGFNNTVAYDNLNLDIVTSAPEPSTATLLISLLPLGAIVYRRKSKSTPDRCDVSSQGRSRRRPNLY
jgi:hypothetical protein